MKETLSVNSLSLWLKHKHEYSKWITGELTKAIHKAEIMSIKRDKP